MKLSNSPPAATLGFTLVELALAMTLAVAMISAVAMSVVSASRAYRDARLRSAVSAQAHRMVEFVVDQVVEAEAEGITPQPDPDLGSSDITYRRGMGCIGSEIQWTTLKRIELRLEPSELDDGLDNNGNGLVDEQIIVFTEDVGEPEEREAIRSHWVSELLEGELPNGIDDNMNGLIDESGLTFTLDGEVLTVRLTLERIGTADQRFTKTVETSVRIRN